MVTFAFPNWLATTFLVYLIGFGIFFLLLLVLTGIGIVILWREPLLSTKDKIIQTIDGITGAFAQSFVWPLVIIGAIVVLITTRKLPF